MRSIKKIHTAALAPIGDLLTYTALPAGHLDQIDPFIFLNHHGPQNYPPRNAGLPFGPHPHRGMETVTIILSGDVKHRDSMGSDSTIYAGGVQWMTAGSGLIHSENSSEAFMANGGKLELLQLWINLPANLKMTEPVYKGFQEEQIPHFTMKEGIDVKLIAGNWDEHKAAFKSITDVHLYLISFRPESLLDIHVPAGRNIFFYVISGRLNVNGQFAGERQLVEFHNNEGILSIKCPEHSLLLLGHAEPLNEPFVARGPFVMNSEEEILQANKDFREGKLGVWVD